MYARVITATIKLENLKEIDKIERDFVLPSAKKLKGFKGFYALVDRKTGKGMVVTLWNAEADMMASESSTYYKENNAKLAPFFSTQPAVEHYEVSIKK